LEVVKLNGLWSADSVESNVTPFDRKNYIPQFNIKSAETTRIADLTSWPIQSSLLLFPCFYKPLDVEECQIHPTQDESSSIPSFLIINLYWLLKSMAILKQNPRNLKWYNQTSFLKLQNQTPVLSEQWTNSTKINKRQKMYFKKLVLADKVTNLVDSI